MIGCGLLLVALPYHLSHGGTAYSVLDRPRQHPHHAAIFSQLVSIGTDSKKKTLNGEEKEAEAEEAS
jgi:hypothetical protein